MNVLVAGGAGFIGSNLIEKLLSLGSKVICIDNFFIGTKKNIEQFKENPNFVFYEENLCDRAKSDLRKSILSTTWQPIPTFKQALKILRLNT